MCKEAGAWQDQIAASYGGFNRINFNSDGYEVLPLIINPERKRQLNNNLMMFFTGFTRFSSDVQKANASNKADKVNQLKEMLALVDEAEKVLVDKQSDLDEFGRLLDLSLIHILKKRIQFIIDELLKENFITVKEDDNVIILEENEEGGESRLKFKTKSSNTMTIENIDKKHTEMYFFKDTSKFSMYKSCLLYTSRCV